MEERERYERQYHFGIKIAFCAQEMLSEKIIFAALTEMEQKNENGSIIHIAQRSYRYSMELVR